MYWYPSSLYKKHLQSDGAWFLCVIQIFQVNTQVKRTSVIDEHMHRQMIADYTLPTALLLFAVSRATFLVHLSAVM